MNDVQVRLSCTCGREVLARAKDAGGSIACDCGSVVLVPSLSALRTIAGADAYTTNPVEAIRKLHAAGESPAGDSCIRCSCAKPVIYNCTAVCERSRAGSSAGSASDGLLSWLFLPFVFNVLLYFRRAGSVTDRYGHDVEVSFQLPVCEQCASQFGKPTRPSVAKQLTTNNPLLNELLDFYPELTLTVKRE